MTPKFDNAKFYTCDDCVERLSWLDPYEALWEHFEKAGEGELG